MNDGYLAPSQYAPATFMPVHSSLRVSTQLWLLHYKCIPVCYLYTLNEQKYNIVQAIWKSEWPINFRHYFVHCKCSAWGLQWVRVFSSIQKDSGSIPSFYLCFTLHSDKFTCSCEYYMHAHVVWHVRISPTWSSSNLWE